MGNIIMVVAVFDSHIESNAVATMNPSTRRAGCPPMSLRMCSAMRL